MAGNVSFSYTYVAQKFIFSFFACGSRFLTFAGGQRRDDGWNLNETAHASVSFTLRGPVVGTREQQRSSELAPAAFGTTVNIQFDAAHVCKYKYKYFQRNSHNGNKPHK